MLSYAFEILTLVAIFVVGSLGLALIVTRAGLLTMAHGASFGLGAYAYALLTTEAGWPAILALAMAAIVPAVVGASIAYFGSELDEEQFAVTTLALNILIVNVMINWTGLTHGSYGISQIPKILLGLFDARIEFMGFCLLVALFAYILLLRLSNSGFGTLLFASARQRHVLESLGTSVIVLRVRAMAIGSGVGGIAGALLAMHATYIAPQLFELHLSILLLAMVVIAANGTLNGAVLGAVTLVLLPELLRFAIPSASAAGPLRQIIFAVLLLAVIFVQANRNTSAKS